MFPHRTKEELESGLETIRQSPKMVGRLEMIVRRPEVDQREVLETGSLDLEMGLAGDTWKTRGSKSMPDGSANPEAQVMLMNARVIDLLTQDRQYWSLAGDQLYVDLDLGSLEAGTRLQIGTAILEITALPHTGCAKFSARFGSEALRWVNSPVGRELRLRGMCARVVQPGTITVGDAVTVC